jgi:DNA primase
MAIAKEDRACVVEGNTDVIALRQAGFHPVVASMGTALTEEQLRELRRLTLRIWLCFDGDKAGEAATLRGMELAAGLGFEVKVVSLPPGLDPADAPEQFASRLASAAPYVVHRVRLELQQAPDRQEAFRRVRDLLARFDDSPDRQDALQLVADRLDLPRETLARLAPSTRAPGRGEEVTPRILDAGVRLERDVLAAVLAHESLREMLREITPEHFDVDAHREVRAHLVDGAVLAEEAARALAELDARSAAAAIDERTGTELLFRLRMRQLRRELQSADLERTRELQDALQKIQHAVAGLA